MFQTLTLNGVILKGNALISKIIIVFQAGSMLLSITTFFYFIYYNSEELRS